MVVVTRVGNRVKVYRPDTLESSLLPLNSVEMVYKPVSSLTTLTEHIGTLAAKAPPTAPLPPVTPPTDTVAIKMRKLEFDYGITENLEPKIADLMIAGEVITSEAQFEVQHAKVFFDDCSGSSGGSGGSVVATIDSIAEMELYTGDSTLVVVLGGVDYGIFAATSATLTNNGGTIYTKAGGGHWVRQFDKMNGICPSWWKAQGDGVTDDIIALEACGAYAIANKVNIVFRSGVYRVTRTWVIGFKFLDEADMWNRNFATAPSYDDVAYGDARFCEHIHIKGGSNTTIWGDFASPAPTSVVYYGIIGGGNSASRRLQPPHHGFEEIHFAGQVSNAGNTYVQVIPTNTNMYGLCAPRTPSLIVHKCAFNSCGIGIYGQDLYQSNITDCKGDSCLQGMLLIGHNATRLSNNSFSNCTSGLYVNGAVMAIDMLWFNNCPTGIKIGGSSSVTDDNGAGTIVINGIYCENDIVADYPNVGQIILGDEDDLEASEVNGVTIKGLSGATGERLMILMQNCKQVTLEGSSILFEPVVSTMAKNTLIVTGESRPVAFTGPGKLYYRDRDITAASFVVS